MKLRFGFSIAILLASMFASVSLAPTASADTNPGGGGGTGGSSCQIHDSTLQSSSDTLLVIMHVKCTRKVSGVERNVTLQRSGKVVDVVHKDCWNYDGEVPFTCWLSYSFDDPAGRQKFEYLDEWKVYVGTGKDPIKRQDKGVFYS